jgi:hypothetical protein
LLAQSASKYFGSGGIACREHGEIKKYHVSLSSRKKDFIEGGETRLLVCVANWSLSSPGHQKDDELLYAPRKAAGNTGAITGEGTHLETAREQTIRHKPSDSGYAFSAPGET